MRKRTYMRKMIAIILTGLLLSLNMTVYTQAEKTEAAPDLSQAGEVTVVSETLQQEASTNSDEDLKSRAASEPLNMDVNPASVFSPVTVTIYHTNDMHGALAGTDQCIGVDKVAAIKDATEHAILVDAGDATQGLPLASLSKGTDIIGIMNLAGYDLMAAGNHEFDYGSAQLLANANLADFPILSANIYNKTTGSLLLRGTGTKKDNTGCHKIIDAGGVQIGFFGLTTLETKTATNPSGITDVEFRDEVDAARREIDELEAEGADAIVAVAHLGEYTNVPCDSSRLAGSMTGEYQDKLDVIIDGHSHTVENNKVVNNVLIQQTGTGLVNLGRIELTVSDGGQVDNAAGSMLSYEDITAEPKKEVTDKINAIKAEQDKTMSKRLCDVKGTFWGGYVNDVAQARITETNLGDFTADAYRDAAQAFVKNASGMEGYQGLPVLAVENGGGIRASLEEGEMTMGDLVTVFPFSNTLMIKEVTPKIVYEMLEQSVSLITGLDDDTGQLMGEPNGGFLQVGGFSFAYNPSASAGAKVERVEILSAGGRTGTIDRGDDSTPLLLVSNNFIMSGGNDYSMLTGAKQVGEIGGELETMEEYIRTQTQGGTTPLKAGLNEGRIRVNGGSSQKGYYEACIRVVEAVDSGQQGTPAVDRQVSLYIDDSKVPISKTTDHEGIVRVLLANGEHRARLSPDENESFTTVNNYVGLGIDTGDPNLLPQTTYREPDTRIEFTVPSFTESVIAPARSFYVRGNYSGISFEEGKDYEVEVSVYLLGQSPEAGGHIFRKVSANTKERGTLKTNEITNPDSDSTDFSGSGMPGLISKNADDQEFRLGDQKCYFDDNHFAAMIPGGMPDPIDSPDYVDDQMGWVDSSGVPYLSMPEGAYQVRVTVSGPDSQAVASAEKQIIIGSTEDKVLSGISPDTHKSRIAKFAEDQGYRVYNDPFPGYWTDQDGRWLCEIGHEWRAADATEYLTGRVHFVIYNINENSKAYNVELGVMQDRRAIDERLFNYYYSTGEPDELGGTKSNIEAFAQGDKLEFVRAELKSSKDEDGVYRPDASGEFIYDMNVDDGIEATAGQYISLYGVTAPIQIAQEDIVRNKYPDGKYEFDNTYILNNKIQTVKYHITGQGVDVTYEKDVRLNRIMGGKDNCSELEFKHVLPVTKDMENKTLTVIVEAYDTHDAPVSGTEEIFEIRVAAKKPADSPDNEENSKPADSPDNEENSKPPTDKTELSADNKENAGDAPITGDAQSVKFLLALLIGSAMIMGYMYRRRESKKREW